MYDDILKNWRKYSRYFWNPGILKNEELMQRPIYKLNEWLILSKYIKMSSGEYSALQVKIFTEFLTDFFSKDIYSSLTPTVFARKTLMNPVYVNSNDIKKIYILSKSLTDAQKKSKERFIKRYFTNSKIEFIHVPANGKKGEILREYGIDFNLIVDDEIPNIRNIAEEFTDLTKKEFLIPEYGYNKMPIDLKALIEEKGGIITYYNPFK